MPSYPYQQFGARIKAARKRKNLTQQAVADHLGISRAAVTQWEKGETAPRTDKIPALSAFLGENMFPQQGDFELFGDDTPITDLQAVYKCPVLGAVQVGIWEEITEKGFDDPLTINISRDIRFPRSAYFAMITKGNSMNECFFEGEHLVCIDYNDEINLKGGDFVIVNRFKENRTLRETTVKQIVVKYGEIELWNRSTDSRYVIPIYDAKSAGDLEIIGLVLWAQRWLS